MEHTTQNEYKQIKNTTQKTKQMNNTDLSKTKTKQKIPVALCPGCISGICNSSKYIILNNFRNPIYVFLENLGVTFL